MKTTATWKEKMEFIAVSNSGHEVVMDAAEAAGGEDGGVRPKELLLKGLAGCTGMDVISILRKMRIEPKSFKIEVETELTEEHPKVFETIKMKYIFSGEVDEEKARRAVDLSQDKYCGVSAMLKKSSPIEYEVVIEN